MRSWVLPLLGWLVLGTALLALLSSRQGDPLGDVGERQLYYALGPDDELVISLHAREPMLRFLVHLETPDPGSRDELHTWVYGLGLSLERPDAPTVNREFWTRSRRSVLEVPGLGEADAMLDPRRGYVITDSRILELDLGHLLPEGGSLHLRALLPPGEEREDQRVLVRPFRQREAAARERLRLVASPERLADRMRHLYPFGWESLSPEERLRLTGWARDRLSASFFTGESLAVHRLGEPSPRPTATREGYRLEPGQATALTVRGPCVLSWRLRLAGAVEGSPPPEPLEPEVLALEGRPAGSDWPPQHPPGRVELPAGAVWSLRWLNPWRAPPVLLDFQLDPLAGHLWGEPPGAAGEQPLAPETRRLTLYRADAGLPPVLVPLATGEAYGSVAIEARPLPSADWLARPTAGVEQEPVTVSFSAYDDDGNHLGTGSFRVPFTYAPFERYVERERVEAGEPVTVHVFHSWRATTLSVTADGPVDLRFLAPLDVEPRRSPVYDTPEGWRARYAPWELAPYVSLTPINHEALVRDGRLLRLDATVRPEPVPRPGGARFHTRALPPDGSPPAHLLVERFRGSGPFQRWHRSLLGERERLRVPRDGALLVDYRVPAEHVGARAFIQCGEREASDLLVASAGRLAFRGLEPGWQDCAFSAPEGFYLARAPGGERWARRKVYRAERGLSATVEVKKGEPAWVFVRTYAPSWAGPPEVEVLLDGGQPRRHGGPSTSLSRGRRRLVLEAVGPARLEDREQGELLAYQGVRVLLGDDLAPGAHRVSVRLLAPEDARLPPLYARFESTRAPLPPPIDAHWTEDASCGGEE